MGVFILQSADIFTDHPYLGRRNTPSVPNSKLRLKWTFLLGESSVHFHSEFYRHYKGLAKPWPWLMVCPVSLGQWHAMLSDKPACFSSKTIPCDIVDRRILSRAWLSWKTENHLPHLCDRHAGACVIFCFRRGSSQKFGCVGLMHIE